MTLLMSVLRRARRLFAHEAFKRRNPTCRVPDMHSVDPSSRLGEYVVLFKGARLNSSKVGRYSYIQSGTSLFNCEVGSFCSIAANVTIGLASHPLSMVSTHPSFFDDTQPLPAFFVRGRSYERTLERTVIGSDVWIGQGSMIKAGVKIGHGAVIGAGAVVVKDIPPYAVVGGVPARLIKFRFDERTVQRLLETEWWNFSGEELSKYASSFDIPENFLEAYALSKTQEYLLKGHDSDS